MTNEVIPTKVGIGLAVLRKNGRQTEVLLGKRNGSHGAGQWALPGGHMDPLESFAATAYRELAEEVGEDFKIFTPQVVSVINLVEYAPKHYVDIGMIALHDSGDPVVMEPEKCDGWVWFDIDNLPSPRFATVDRIISSFKLGHVNGIAVVWDAE